MKNNIIEASFLLSASNLSECPIPDQIEIVCLGRSNVGKSSFINFFLGKKGLAKSSSTPGKTRLINFFQAFYLSNEGERIAFKIIDLPGFGYAKVSKDQKKLWEKNLAIFLKQRQSIKLFLHLIDSRHLDLKIDQEVRGFLKELCRGDQKVIEILTKADKLKNQEKNKLLASKKILISTLRPEEKTTSLEALQRGIIDLALGREGEKEER